MLAKHEVNQLIQISKKAGNSIMKYFSQEMKVQTCFKSDNSPLSLADLASNKIICEGLRSMSNLPILSEENTIEAYEIRKKHSSFWLIDPLDGTKEFLSHSDEFTTNIALIKDNHVVAGFVYIPAKQEMYWAIKNQGAFLDKKQEMKQLECVHFSWESPRIVVSKSHLDSETKVFIERYTNPSIMKIGSSIKFLKIATGEADLYPRCTQIKEWDVAAAHIILEEAGGFLYNMNTKRAINYNSRSLRLPPFVAHGKNKMI